jgi:ankyrin repeat protein
MPVIPVDEPTYKMAIPIDLHQAAKEGNLKGIHRQMEIGENIDVTDIDGRTALHFAVSAEQKSAVELLISLNASPDIKEKNDGDTPLHWAVRSGDLDLVNLIAPKMNDINTRNNNGETPAMIAAKEDKQEILRALITYGAKIDMSIE